jgi:hypothetical protein
MASQDGKLASRLHTPETEGIDSTSSNNIDENIQKIPLCSPDTN